MFTGIIEEVGRVRTIQRGSTSCVLQIEADHVLSDVHLGDSIATNGVCLTVTRFDARSFSADVMHETLDRSTLGSLRPGGRVNLERAMRADGRFGGHIVSGHIDGVGTVTAIEADDNAVWFTIAAAPELVRHVVEKGSIAIDGISLTVASVAADAFSVSVIPHTRAHTTLADRHVSDGVNLETDVVGKYVERLLTCGPAPSSYASAGWHAKPDVSFGEAPAASRRPSASGGRIDEAFLREHGF